MSIAQKIARGRPRGAAAGLLRAGIIIIVVPADLHAAAGGRPAVPPHGVDGGLRPARRADVRPDDRAGAGQLCFSGTASRNGTIPVLRWLHEGLPAHARLVLEHPGFTAGAGARRPWPDVISWRSAARSGSEFLPHLDEGAIWVRGTLAPSTGPTRASQIIHDARLIFARFPEVTQVVSPGRPSGRRHRRHAASSTPSIFVDLRPRDQWRLGVPDQGRT